nr:MAG TPA: hypothetical protein [Caudoviricetes sp.]
MSCKPSKCSKCKNAYIFFFLFSPLHFHFGDVEVFFMRFFLPKTRKGAFFLRFSFRLRAFFSLS